MLLELIQKAIEYGGNVIDIEYKDGKQWVTAMHEAGSFGVGFSIAALDEKEAKQLFQEMNKLKRRKEVTIDGMQYRLAFSKYENFMEWAYNIKIMRKHRR